MMPRSLCWRSYRALFRFAIHRVVDLRGVENVSASSASEEGQVLSNALNIICLLSSIGNRIIESTLA